MFANKVTLLLWVTLAFASIANADPQSKSFSHWSLSEKKVVAVFTLSRADLAAVPGLEITSTDDSRWLTHLSEQVQLSAAIPCQLENSKVVASSGAYLRSRLEWQCEEPLTNHQAVDISIELLFDRIPSHLHFANFEMTGNVHAEKLFSQSERKLTLPLRNIQGSQSVNSGPVLTSYIRFGFEHILIGLDHIAFLLALLLLRGSWRQTLWVVTGFTLGHSITLSLSTLGLLNPNIGFTEALIGLSIALIAIENIAVREDKSRLSAHAVGAALLALAGYNLYEGTHLSTVALLGLSLFSWCYLQLSHSQARARRIRPMITALFGLIHGFGFASVLLEVGLPESSRAMALLGFNLGVELGQIFIVGVFLGAGALLGRLIVARDQIATDFLSTLLCALGVYWFLQRLYF